MLKKERRENVEVGIDMGFFWQDGRHKFLEYTDTRTLLMIFFGKNEDKKLWGPLAPALY